LLDLRRAAKILQSNSHLVVPTCRGLWFRCRFLAGADDWFLRTGFPRGPMPRKSRDHAQHLVDTDELLVRVPEWFLCWKSLLFECEISVA